MSGDLQELQQTAAAGDAAAWTLFERAEPRLSEAIAAAATGVECEAVESEIQQLAATLTRTRHPQ